METDQWEEVEAISDEPKTWNRKSASYKAFPSAVTLYGTTYRAVVVHSDAQAAAERIGAPNLHRMTVEIEERPQYGKGRPKADSTRNLKETRFGSKLSI